MANRSALAPPLCPTKVVIHNHCFISERLNELWAEWMRHHIIFNSKKSFSVILLRINTKRSNDWSYLERSHVSWWPTALWLFCQPRKHFKFIMLFTIIKTWNNIKLKLYLSFLSKMWKNWICASSSLDKHLHVARIKLKLKYLQRWTICRKTQFYTLIIMKWNGL